LLIVVLCEPLGSLKQVIGCRLLRQGRSKPNQRLQNRGIESNNKNFPTVFLFHESKRTSLLPRSVTGFDSLGRGKRDLRTAGKQDYRWADRPSSSYTGKPLHTGVSLLLHVASKKETPIRQNFLEKPDKATKNLAIEFDVTPMINYNRLPKSRINPG
jgi:hypothetical protein